MSLIKRLVFFCALSFITYPVFLDAQRNLPGNFPRSVDEQEPDTIDQEELIDELPDTVRIYTPYRLKTDFVFEDTVLNALFHQYDLIRLQNEPFLNLGNNGSPHRPAIYKIDRRQGLDLGWHALDLYRKRYEEQWLIDSKRPFAVFRFAQKSFKQEDLQLESRFSKTFQNGLHLDLYYSSIQYKGEFTDQITKNRNGAFSIWYHAPKGNYDFLMSYHTNDIRQQDNGGIPNSDSLMKISQYRQNTITLDGTIDGRTRQTDREFSIQNGFNLKWKGSTLGAMHRLGLRHESLSYLDQTSTFDSMYYHAFYVRDTQQILLKANGVINEFRLDGLINNKNYLMAGLRQEYYKIDQGPNKSNTNLLSLIGQYQQTLFGTLTLNAEGQWGLIENLGEYYLKGQLQANSRKLGSLEGHIILQRSPVPISYKQIYNYNKTIFTAELDKPLTNQLGGSMTIAALAFKAGLDQSILSNTIYLDSLRLPRQNKSAVSVTHIYFNKAFRLGSFHSSHGFHIQISSDNEMMRLPGWYTNHQLFYHHTWFKKAMDVMTGFETRIVPEFRTTGYFPLMAGFYNASRSNTGLHPALEFFFNFQLKNFRGFFKVEGLEYFLYPAGKTFYETYDNPLFRTNMRIGFTWTMRD